MISRLRLAADTVFNVSPAGVDTDQGASASFRTIAYAVKWVSANVDAAGFQVKIQVAPGLYTDTIELGDVIGIKPGGWPNKPLWICGNPANPGR